MSFVTQVRFIVADVFDGIAKLEDQSVDLVFTSPPFLALRSYLPADHPDKGKEIGSEPTPAVFIDTLLDVVEALEPKLAPHGSICFELGDTYSGSGGAGGDYNANGLREGQEKFKAGRANNGRADIRADTAAGLVPTLRSGALGKMHSDGWPLDKSLCLIPESFRWALAYGRNPFNGRTTPPWRVRNVIRWHRPNPPVGALGDKVRPSTSDIVVACKSRTRYFDLDAVRNVNNPDRVDELAMHNPKSMGRPASDLSGDGGTGSWHPAGAPPLDTWIIPTQPYKGSHYATFPDDLVTKPIKMMCPERVCRVCGEPSRRIVTVEYTEIPNRPLRDDDARRYGSIDGKRHNDHRATSHPSAGWTDCGCWDDGEDGTSHPRWRKGLVLDPFAGSGTTLGVAIGHGRDAIGIDLDPANADLARERVGMWLSVEYLAVVSAP